LKISLPSRYKNTGEVLEGGQGKIFICKDSQLDRKVAIKFMKPARDRKELIREIASMRDIASKHVVQIYDIVSDDHSKQLGLVEEFIPGSDLQPVNLDRPAGKRTLLKTLFQIASGIADIHSHGKVHRDIKPTNMKLDDEGIVKIFDFSLTGIVKDNEHTEAKRGTTYFKAPEYYSRKPLKVTPELDTYAFGVTTWYLATNDLPNPLKQIPPQSGAPSFATLNLELSAKLTSFLDRTLMAASSERPRMSDLRDALAAELLFGKHRARFHDKELARPNDKAQLKTEAGSIVVNYTGYAFVIDAAVGEVYINNMPAIAGDELSGSCVVTIGNPARGMYRTFVPFEISHPEVVL
jgi:eukaryotic-like serine/threonine-protein kinase